MLLFSLTIATAAITAGTYVAMHRQPNEGPVQWVEGYTANLSFTDLQAPSKSYQGKVYSNVLSQPREFRVDLKFPNRTRIEIWRQDPSTFLVLDPETKAFWIPADRAALTLISPTRSSAANGIKRLVGREKVNGRLADHWEVTNINGVMEQYWEDARLHVIVKSVKPGISMYELTNIEEGRQRDELFVVPPGYKEVARESNQ